MRKGKAHVHADFGSDYTGVHQDKGKYRESDRRKVRNGGYTARFLALRRSCPAGRRSRNRKNGTYQVTCRIGQLSVQAHPVYPGSLAVRHHRRQFLQRQEV